MYPQADIERRQRMSALGQKRTFRSAITMSALPPKADMCGATRDVRYGPKADIHSITSSARAMSVGGTLRPRLLAVERLMDSTNLVGCITGSSEGFSPLRMRPA